MSPYREAPPPSRVCPRCAGGLSRRALADTHVEECPSCKGVFVEITLIPRIVDALDLGGEVIDTFPRGPVHLTVEAHGPTYLKCPRCSVIMNRRLFATGAQVIIDRCTEHGIWFDAAELRAVADFAAGGGMERAAARDAAEREKRAAEAERARRQQRPAEATLHAVPHHHTDPSLLEDILHFFRRWG
jgi:Zn-finger nucleic acid-binding protein